MLDGPDTATRVSHLRLTATPVLLAADGSVTEVLIDICVVAVRLPLIVLFWSTASASGADPPYANVHVCPSTAARQLAAVIHPPTIAPHRPTNCCRCAWRAGANRVIDLDLLHLAASVCDCKSYVTVTMFDAPVFTVPEAKQ